MIFVQFKKVNNHICKTLLAKFLQGFYLSVVQVMIHEL